MFTFFHPVCVERSVFIGVRVHRDWGRLAALSHGCMIQIPVKRDLRAKERVSIRLYSYAPLEVKRDLNAKFCYNISSGYRI